jgi:uncharacterized protein YhfF/GNAT superfamily N-acetyltransferase
MADAAHTLARPSTLPSTLPSAGAVAAFWADYCRAVRLAGTTPCQAWHFGDSPELAHELVELVLYGPKRATAELARPGIPDPATDPAPGGYCVVTESDGTPRAVIRYTTVERRPLGEVDAAFAWDEGEGDRSLADWLRIHRTYFARECARDGTAFSDASAVILQRFELMYPFERALHPAEPRLLPGYIPGALADSAALQTLYYAQHHGFGAFFEAGRLQDIGAFLDRYDPARDGVWLVVHAGRIHGSLVVDSGGASGDRPPDAGEGARLRWFMLSDALRGRGFGERLLAAAMAFCRVHHHHVELTTFAGLDAARHLYERHGFRLLQRQRVTTWGPPCDEQRWVWDASDRVSSAAGAPASAGGAGGHP